MTTYRKAFLWTATPIVALSMISTIAGPADCYESSDTLCVVYVVWYAAAGLGVVAILAAIGFAIAERKRATAGIVAGIGVGFLSLAITCFANVATLM